MNITLDKIKSWIKISDWLKEAKVEEMKQRKEIIEYVCENKDSGAKGVKDSCIVEFEDGDDKIRFKLLTDSRPELKFEYDEDTFMNIYSDMNSAQQDCFEYIPVFRKKEYNNLSDKDKKMVNKLLISKPKSPNIEIKEL